MLPAPIFERPPHKTHHDVVMVTIEEKTRPPKKISGIRDTEHGRQLRMEAYEALSKILVNQRVEFSGIDVTRELLNSYVSGYETYVPRNKRHKRKNGVNRIFIVCGIDSNRYGIWRLK